MTIQPKPIIQERKPLCAGINVGSVEQVLLNRKNGISYKTQKFANAPADDARLVKMLADLPGIILCLEATGVYHIDLSIALHDAGVALMWSIRQHLVDKGKAPLQALCAVMRKLLHAIHGMLKYDKPFDNTRFHAIPA